MTTVELLEDRIADLEKQIYGTQKTKAADSNLLENPVIDNLLHVNTLISSAMSGREKANTVIKRLPELNTYIDSICESIEIPIEAKLQLLLATMPDIKKNVIEKQSQMKELMHVLETDRFRDIPELSNKLNDSNLVYLQVYEETQQLTAETNEFFSKYNEVITSISKLLIALDAEVTAAEIAAMPKKQLD